jgi:predicted nucleic acid-binding protein
LRDNRVPYILDSYALLAYLGAEEGHQRIGDLLERAAEGSAGLYLTIINFGEVLYIIERERGLTAAQATIAAVDQLPIQVVDADREMAFAAAHVKAHYPLAYADCFAIALARSLDGVVITGDPEFRSVTTLVEVEWLPQANIGR